MKLMSLGRADACVVCGAALDPTVTAWGDSRTKRVTCTSCRPVEPLRAVSAGRLESPPIDHGTPGLGARQPHDRRIAEHEAAIAERWGTGRIGRFVRVVADEPHATKAWSKGAAGEEALGGRMNDDLAGQAVVLHDRTMPGTKANIDHVVIGPNGVWIVDAKKYQGQVELRDVAGWFKSDLRLYVNNRDRTKLAHGLALQVAAVRKVLDDMMQVTVPIVPCLCFVDADWPLGSRPFAIHGVRVTWPKKLIEAILQPGPMTLGVIDHVARGLSQQLPATSR